MVPMIADKTGTMIKATHAGDPLSFRTSIGRLCKEILRLTGILFWLSFSSTDDLFNRYSVRHVSNAIHTIFITVGKKLGSVSIQSVTLVSLSQSILTNIDVVKEPQGRIF